MSDAKGRFSAVGIGPGDPELITRKAARIIGAADVVAYHAGVRKESHARRIAADLIPLDAVEEELRYPVTTGTTDHPGGYVGALADFYDECERRVCAHLEAGRDVALLAEGDPLFYGSSMYLLDRLRDRYATEVVPGVPAYAAATAGLPEGIAHLELLERGQVRRRPEGGAAESTHGRALIERLLHALGGLDGIHLLLELSQNFLGFSIHPQGIPHPN